MEQANGNIFRYNLGGGVRAFTAGREAALPCPVTCGHQVHGCKVAEVPRAGMTREDLEGYDALVTNVPGVAVGIRTADCIPVLLYDPARRAVGAAHAGWRGTVARVVQRTISEMARLYGTRPGDLVALIGPGISRAAFQVGDEVVSAFAAAGFPLPLIHSFDGPRSSLPASSPTASASAGSCSASSAASGLTSSAPDTIGLPASPSASAGSCSATAAAPAGATGLPTWESLAGGDHIDLKEANRWLLLEAGVPADRIQVSDLCTFADARFYSARREGVSCGRNISAIALL